MDYKVAVFNFDGKKHLKTIGEIGSGITNIAKEPLFKKIARDILKKQNFEKITEGPSINDLKGVPFDFIALEKGNLSLIELKGSVNTFNYSSELQFARLFHVVSELKKRQIKRDISTFLLQINLNLTVYQLLDSKFYSVIFKNINKAIVFKEMNGKLGYKTPIVPIVDDIIKRMRQKGVKL